MQLFLKQWQAFFGGLVLLVPEADAECHRNLKAILIYSPLNYYSEFY